jgi:hypothetical protein
MTNTVVVETPFDLLSRIDAGAGGDHGRSLRVLQVDRRVDATIRTLVDAGAITVRFSVDGRTRLLDLTSGGSDALDRARSAAEIELDYLLGI